MATTNTEKYIALVQELTDSLSGLTARPRSNSAIMRDITEVMVTLGMKFDRRPYGHLPEWDAFKQWPHSVFETARRELVTAGYLKATADDHARTKRMEAAEEAGRKDAERVQREWHERVRRDTLEYTGTDIDVKEEAPTVKGPRVSDLMRVIGR